MCRLVAYMGQDILLDTVIVEPANSILKQSLHAKESTIHINGDGFGLGWYAPNINNTPALFTSISPAWNDRNLLNIAAKIKSPCFFAHVRSASAGGVTNYNCHPFVHGKWMLMHNGGIHDFILVKRHLRHLLDDDIYHWIQGDTDSEHIFALLMQMAKGRDLSRFEAIAQLIKDVFKQIHELTIKFGSEGTTHLNLCITDGSRIIATRYCNDIHTKPESMHYSLGSSFSLKNDSYHMIRDGKKPQCILISSEKLNEFTDEWQEVPANYMLIVNSNFEMELFPL